MRKFIPIILSVVVFFTTLGAYVFLFFNIEGDVARIATAVQGAASLTKRDAIARSVEAFLSDTEGKRNTLETFIVKDANEVSVIEILQKTASKHHVTLSISSVGVSGVSGWSYHDVVDVRFSVDGSFANMTDFIAAIEALPIASRIESGGFETSGSSGWFGSFAATFIKEKP